MLKQRDISQDKTLADLAREALWFLTHTLIAVILLAIVVGVMSLNHPDPDSTAPKQLATLLAFLVPMIGGFLLFALLCSVGAITNVNIASWLFHSNNRWWVAGLAGGLVGVVWNYAASTTFVWRRRRKG